MDNEYVLNRNNNKMEPATPFVFKEYGTDILYGVKIKIYENNYYNVEMTIWEKDGKEQPDLFQVSFYPKAGGENFPSFANDGIFKIGKQGTFTCMSFHFDIVPMLSAGKFFDIDDSSDEILKVAKDNVILFDKLIREEYPGCCLVPKTSEINDENGDAKYLKNRLQRFDEVKNKALVEMYGAEAVNAYQLTETT